MERKFRTLDPFGYEHSIFDQARYEAIMQVLGNEHIEHALEFGCAEGQFSVALASRCEHVLGVDVSHQAIDRARLRLADSGQRNVEFMCGNIRRWTPPADMRFDWIFLADMLPYLEYRVAPHEFEAMTERVVGLLRPQGRVLITNYYRNPEELQEREDYVACFTRQGLALAHRQIGTGIRDKSEISFLLTVLHNR